MYLGEERASRSVGSIPCKSRQRDAALVTRKGPCKSAAGNQFQAANFASEVPGFYPGKPRAVLGRPTISESKASRARTRLLNDGRQQWRVIRAHRSPPILDGEAHGVRRRLEPGWYRQRYVDRDRPPSAILERKPSETRDRPETASYPQGYLWRQQCAPPTPGRPQGGGWSPKPALHGSSPWRPARLLRCGLSVSQLRSERSPRRFDSCRLIQSAHEPWVAGIPVGS